MGRWRCRSDIGHSAAFDFTGYVLFTIYSTPANLYCMSILVVAAQKAKYVMQKLNKLAKGKDSEKPFAFENRGSLAYIGNW